MSTDRTAWIALTDRVRFMGGGLATLFVFGWALWFVPYDDLLDRSGTPLGADYTMFYVAGSIIADGETNKLYDQREHQRRLQALFPNIDERFCLPYRYPPIVALLMAPLSQIPYAWSFALFTAASFAAWFGALVLLTRDLYVMRGRNRTWLLWAAAGWPIAFETFVGGQASMFPLLIVTATIAALRQKRVRLAGALLALACCKPNVLLVFGVGAVVYRPRLLWGAIPTLAGLVTLTVASVGWPVTLQYGTLVTELATNTWTVETPFWKVHTLASWLELAIPGKHRLICTAIGIIAATAVGWKWRTDRRCGSLAIALLLVVNAICNPYTPIYDLSLLLAAAFWTAEDWFADRARKLPEAGHGESQNSADPSAVELAVIYGTLVMLYLGPHFSQAIAKVAGIQLFPLALLVVACWQLARLMNAGSGTTTVSESQLPARS